MDLHGRHRRSIANLELQLHKIFSEHPDSYIKENGEPVIPADALVDVFRAFSDVCDGVQLMTDEETNMLKALLKSNPGLEVTPQILLGFVAEKTKKQAPPRSPLLDDDLDLSASRGRSGDRDPHFSNRSYSSDDSTGNSSHINSRRSSLGPRGPQTPQTLNKSTSVFDTERRQRSTPLTAPSSWGNRRPAPKRRRKSDAGNPSDSEQSTGGWRQRNSRSRGPSIPSSPGPISPETSFSSTSSPPQYPGNLSRPHSRTHSYRDMGDLSYINHPADDIEDLSASTNNRRGRDAIAARNDEAFLNFERELNEDTIHHSISSLHMPRANNNSNSGSDSDDSAMGLVMERQTRSSTVSMEPIDRVDLLQRANEELKKRLGDAERTLSNKLSEHETELEEMVGKIEELKSELVATRREEKELKTKERTNMTQITILESEVAKITKVLEQARATYTSLQKQYQEQCTASEQYRDDLRKKDELIRGLRESASLQELEVHKLMRENESYEEQLVQLENELALAQHAHAQLDEQKHENMLLKETIDRMRFDMDEMRNAAAQPIPPGGSASVRGSISKSLGAELLGKMKGWGMPDDEVTAIEEEEQSVADLDGDETESEDVIQTIITRKTKKKVASRANKFEQRATFEEIKEYSDTATQYDPTLFSVSHSIQTETPSKIIYASMNAQTEVSATQADLKLVPLRPEMEIQTEFEGVSMGLESHTNRGVPMTRAGPEQPEASSSTATPPTPKTEQALGLPAEQADQPPSYSFVSSEEQELEVLRKTHPGVRILPHSHSHVALRRHRGAAEAPYVEGVVGGIPEEVAEDYKIITAELGVECSVITRMMEESEKIPSAAGKGVHQPNRRRRSSRFYNIYNTYVYGAGPDADDSDADASESCKTAKRGNFRVAQVSVTTAVVGIGVAFACGMVITQLMMPDSNVYLLPGSPSFVERALWSRYNNMGPGAEGFVGPGHYHVKGAGGVVAKMVRGVGGAMIGLGKSGGGASGMGAGAAAAEQDGSAVVWQFMQRVTGGAARIVKGWPT